jgi:hypothetical protein
MPDKNRKLTELQQRFLDALAGPAKGNMREAMDMAGYSENTMPHHVYGTLAEEITEIAQKLIAANSVKAAVSMVGILDNPNVPGNLNLLSAAKELLDRAGVAKKVDDKTTIKADTIFILPQKDGEIVVDAGSNQE